MTREQRLALVGAILASTIVTIDSFTFFQSIYLQQVAGWSALGAGATALVPTGVMFLLSSRVGRLADRFGPRGFLTMGPLVIAAVGAIVASHYAAGLRSGLGQRLPRSSDAAVSAAEHRTFAAIGGDRPRPHRATRDREGVRIACRT